MAWQLNPERFYTHEMVEAMATRVAREKDNKQRETELSGMGSMGENDSSGG